MGLTVLHVHRLRIAVLLHREFDLDWELEVVSSRQQRNHAAYLSHWKQHAQRLNLLE